MANAGDLYLGDNAGLSRQLDWRHKIIEEDKRSRTQAADQIRNDVLQLGQTVSNTIRETGAPEWMGGRKMETDGGEYAGLGSGQNAARFEEMKYKVVDKEREYKIRHNQQVITAGMHNIKMAKSYDLNARWYGQDPVALEKSWSKRHDDILQDESAYFAHLKVDKYPSFYSKADRERLEMITNATYKSDEQKQAALEGFRATPSVFSMWAKDNGLVNSKFIGTYPQATVALRKRMVDMGYLDGDMFADTKDGGLYAGYGTGTSQSNKNVDNALGHTVPLEEIITEEIVPEDTAEVPPLVISDSSKLPDSYGAAGFHATDAEQSATELTALVKNFNKPRVKLTKEQQLAENIRLEAQAKKEREALLEENKKGVYKNPKTGEIHTLNPPPKIDPNQLGYPLTINPREIAFSEKAAAIIGYDTSRNRQLVANEGGYEAAGPGKGGMLYDDLNDIAFPGGFNAGHWAYGKSPREKKALADRMAVGDDAKPRPEMAKLILDLLNTQGRKGDTPEQAQGARRFKYSMANDNGLRGKIKISKRGMLAGVDFASRYNLGQLIRNRPWLKDKNERGYVLDRKFPQKFKDILADITYRFGGGAFKKSKSLWTPTRDEIDFDSTLKEIVEAKTYEDRKVALERFKKLFESTSIHLNEGHTDRIKAIIKSIDDLKREWI